MSVNKSSKEFGEDENFDWEKWEDIEVNHWKPMYKESTRSKWAIKKIEKDETPSTEELVDFYQDKFVGKAKRKISDMGIE